MRLRFRRKLWPALPGLAIATVAVGAIVLPIGSDELGARFSSAPGLLPASARWARDLHDGFWRQRAEPVAPISFRTPLSAERRQAQELCWLGRAREAVALYRELGVVTDSDRQALLTLGGRLICEADYALSEWFAREGDRLLGGAILRNNLAWHYAQTGIRKQQALALAKEAVDQNPNACNIDTLAWVLYNCGLADAARTAAEATLAVNDPWLTPLLRQQQDGAKQSSRHLLAVIESGLSPEAFRREQATRLPTQPIEATVMPMVLTIE